MSSDRQRSLDLEAIARRSTAGLSTPEALALAAEDIRALLDEVTHLRAIVEVMRMDRRQR